MPKQISNEEELCEKCAPRLGEILCPCLENNKEVVEETVEKNRKNTLGNLYDMVG